MESSVLSHPETGQAFYEEGLRFKNEGNLAEAERSFAKALELAPSNHESHFELANVYAERYDRLGSSKKASSAELLLSAARELEQTVMLQPDFLAAHYNLGIVYKRLGRFEEAREEFKRVLELDPRSINAQMQIGSVYEEQGFFEEAKDAYRRAWEMDHGNPDIKDAMDHLEGHAEAAHRQMIAETEPGRYASFRDSFNYSPFSHAQQMEVNRHGEAGAGQGIQQAVPYLATMLVQQFMKLRENAGGGSEEEGT